MYEIQNRNVGFNEEIGGFFIIIARACIYNMPKLVFQIYIRKILQLTNISLNKNPFSLASNLSILSIRNFQLFAGIDRTGIRWRPLES